MSWEETIREEPKAEGWESTIVDTKKEGPSIKQIAGGLAAEIAISESAKAGGTAAGAYLGTLGGPTAPVTIPTAAGIGYVTGALSGGFTGSIAAQKIEGQDDISYGRATASALLNLIPGGVGKAGKVGPKWLRRITTAMAKRPVATTAAIGGAAGPAAITIERLVETGEAPTMDEMAMAGLVGLTFGAGIGKTSQYGTKLLNRFAGKSPAEIDKLVRLGDPEAVSYVDAVSKDVDPDSFMTAGDIKKYVTEVANTAKARIAPSRVVGEDVVAQVNLAKNRASAGAQTGTILNKKVTEFIQNSPDPQATEKLVFDYISGATGPYPRELAEIGDDISLFRKTIQGYQEELLANDASGQRPLTKLMREKIQQSINSGDYLTREYEFFFNPGYKPTAKVESALRQRLVADGMDPKGAEEYIVNLNKKKASNADDVANFVFSQNAGILKNKQDLSPELRAYLGEVAAPGAMMEGTLSKLARLNAYDTADGNIKTLLRDMGVAKIGGEGIDPNEFVPLTLRRGQAQIEGNDLYVPKPVQQALNDIYAKKADEFTGDVIQDSIKDLFTTGIAASKAAKVVFNPPAYLVQLYGNLISVAQQGMNPLKGFGKGLKAGASQFDVVAKNLSSKSIGELKRLRELGLIGEGVNISDIRAGMEGNIGRQVQKLINPFGKAYSIPDIGLRVSAFENNKSFLTKAAPAIAGDEKLQRSAEEYAARMTNNTYMNYDYLNKGVKTLSKYGGLTQFVFPIEFARNQWNQGVLIKDMISGKMADELAAKFGAVDRSAIRNEGLKRLASTIAAYGATAGAVQLWNQRNSGYTSEEQEALRETVLPEWDRYKSLAFKKGENGKIFWKNASYIAPQAQMLAPLFAGLRGESFKDGMLKASEAIWEEVGGEGNFVMNSLVPAVQNYDPETGRQISKKVDRLASITDRAGWFANETFQPGFQREWNRATSELKPQPKTQTALRQAGIRVNDTTIEDGVRFRFNAIKENLTALSSDYSYQKYKKTGQDLEQEYQKLNQDYRDNAAMLTKHAKNLRTLGKTEDEIIRLMRDNGIGAEKALESIDGRVIDMPKVPRMSITEQYENLPGVTEKEKLDAIMKISKEDPFLAKSLASKHKEMVKTRMLKISERDKAVMALGSDDGTRAAYIWRKMQESPDPDGVYKDFLKKGLIDGQVYSQINSYRNIK